MLRHYFKTYEYFKNLEIEHGEELILNLGKEMHVLEFAAWDIVFNYGDVGNMFYVILKGKVGVKVPTLIELALTGQELLKFLYENYDDILFDKWELESTLISKLRDIRTQASPQFEVKGVSS